VILVGEMRDRETIEITLTAAETGHLVFSTLHTIDASKTVERIIGTFEAGDQQAIRGRLAASFRYFVSQRLVPKKAGGRVPVLEILKSTMRTRDYVERGDSEGKSLLDAMRDGALDGMRCFDDELERLVREDVVTMATALLYATNPATCRCRWRRPARRSHHHALTRSGGTGGGLLPFLDNHPPLGIHVHAILVLVLARHGVIVLGQFGDFHDFAAWQSLKCDDRRQVLLEGLVVGGQ